MKTKVINTRKYFWDMKNLIQNAVATSPTSVDYREAAYLFCKKVEDVIISTAQGIFEIGDDIKRKIQEMNVMLYEAGKPFAEEEPKNSEPYKIAPDKVEEWLKIDASIRAEYSEYTEKEEKTNNELNQWLAKKIQLNIEKISFKDIPSFSVNGNESQETYTKIRELLAEDVELDEDDGKEIEE